MTQYEYPPLPKHIEAMVDLVLGLAVVLGIVAIWCWLWWAGHQGFIQEYNLGEGERWMCLGNIVQTCWK